MSTTQKLFDKRGGYRKLYSFTFSTMIHLGTINFCKRFVSYKDDPLGKTAGQMIGAARSGRQNIIEGSERASTSKETEMKLTDVAKASLAELLGDYEIYLADKGIAPWSKNEPSHQALSKLQLPIFNYTNDVMHDYWCYFQEATEPFTPWINNDDSTVIANTMIVLIQRTMAMLHGQIKQQGEIFLKDGGFREKMYQTRKSERDNNAESTNPICPECGKHMIKRTAHTGSHNGNAFWGCTGFPECKGTRQIEN
ncbi:MAG: four helix bundle suffix domain-containing protein [Kiritimatiellae bacterium]|jgi:restriction system protein|nr:four helix bundle suffix domain-containing protein [Kiritimatiellia bacterium]